MKIKLSQFFGAFMDSSDFFPVYNSRRSNNTKYISYKMSVIVGAHSSRKSDREDVTF